MYDTLWYMDYPYTKYIPLELEIQPHTLSFYERASCINGMLTRQIQPAARRKMRSWRLEAQRCQKSYGNLGYFWLFFMEEIMEILGIQRNHGRNVDLLFFSTPQWFFTANSHEFSVVPSPIECGSLSLCVEMGSVGSWRVATVSLVKLTMGYSNGILMGYSLFFQHSHGIDGPCIDGLPIKSGDFPWRTVK